MTTRGLANSHSLKLPSVFHPGTLQLLWLQSRGRRRRMVERFRQPRRFLLSGVAIVLAALDLLFLVFVLVQFRYLFGGDAVVQVTAGLSYADYARRGFFELVTEVRDRLREGGLDEEATAPGEGEILVEEGLISEEQLAMALGEQQRRGRSLGRVLIDLGLVKEPDLVAALARRARYVLAVGTCASFGGVTAATGDAVATAPIGLVQTQGLETGVLILLPVYAPGSTSFGLDSVFAFVVAVVHVDRLIEEARAAGGRISREPGPTFYGGYAGVFVDPDGHPWEVAHNPGFSLGADGSISLPAD